MRVEVGGWGGRAESMTWSGRAAACFNQATAGASFYCPDAKRKPSKVISAAANGRRSWLSADWSSEGSAGVKPPVWNDINNHPRAMNQSIPFNTSHFLVGCF